MATVTPEAEAGTSSGTGGPNGADVPPVRRHRAGRVWLVVGVVAALVTAGGYWFLLREPTPPPAEPAAGPDATAQVERATLSDTRTWNGTLGHGTPGRVPAATDGTITRVPAQGSAVVRGSELYRVDERPVIAWLGTIPMYRDLSVGDTGDDVEQAETNLAALGYTGFDVDERFTAGTAAAVRAWQRDLGLERTGSVGRGDVVFLPSEGRVGTVHLSAGDAVAPGVDVLDVTGTEQVVTFSGAVADLDLLPVGTAVRIRFADGIEVTGTVTRADVVANPSGDDADPGADDTALEVDVVLDDPVDEALLGSPAEVSVDVATREDVLAVPVTALLALAEGGYAVEVVADDGTTALVPVETGLFAGGLVEVSGEGITDGTRVAVARR